MNELRFAWIYALIVMIGGHLLISNETPLFVLGWSFASLTVAAILSPLVRFAWRIKSKSAWAWFHWLNAVCFLALGIQIVVAISQPIIQSEIKKMEMNSQVPLMQSTAPAPAPPLQTSQPNQSNAPTLQTEPIARPTETSQEPLDSNEVARSVLSRINEAAEERMATFNKLVNEDLDGPYAMEILNPDQLVTSQGVFEQKAKLKSISASLEIRAKNDVAIRDLENQQFEKAAEFNQFPQKVVDTFKAKREEAWRIDNEFVVCRQILNKAIDDALFIFITRGGNVSGVEDGRVVFQSPLNNSEYSRLLLIVNTIEADCTLKKSRKSSVSAMTARDLH